MTNTETFTLDMTDATCPCGNDACYDGFFPIESREVPVPVAVFPSPSGLYFCASCGRVGALDSVESGSVPVEFVLCPVPEAP